MKQAKNNFDRYLKEELIIKKEVDERIIKTLTKNANESLILAKDILENNKSDLWSVVISYYSMFYIANAVICKRGYKIGEKIAHKITSDSLKVLIRNNIKKSLMNDYEKSMDEALASIKTDEIIHSFEKERQKRGIFQYNMSEKIKHSKAKTSFERAQRFYLEILKLME